MLIIKNAEIFSPEYKGKRDVMICAGEIIHISENIIVPEVPCTVIDAEGKYLIPGIIDQHVHVTGGGGEGGFHTRTPEIQLSELIRGGVTTVVGLLGTDGTTRSIEDLYAKTMALNEEGVTAYMMTGAYNYDSPTITGSIDRDIMFCEKIIGAKIAVSDHRSSNISYRELIEMASKVRVAGMLSGKPGIITMHMGDGDDALQPVFKALEMSEIPVGVFRPTHVGRTEKLKKEAFRFLNMGGYIDFTCGNKNPGNIAAYIKEAKKRGLPLDRITVSSDGHGSWSAYDEAGNLTEIGVAGADKMMSSLRYLVTEGRMAVAEALPFFTSNVATAIGLAGTKGIIAEGADADLLIIDSGFELDTVIAKGQIMMESGELKRKGTYE